MPQNKKFIITKDESTANKLIEAGFKLVNSVSAVWTFLNIVPKTFSFAEISKETYSYTNNLFL